MTYALLLMLIVLTLLSLNTILFKGWVTFFILMLFGFWFVCDMFTDSGVNFSVYYHLLNPAKGTSFEDIENKIYVSAAFLVFILFFILTVYFIKRKNASLTSSKWVLRLYFCTLAGVFFTPFAKNIYEFIDDIYYITHSDMSSAIESYKKLDGKINKKYNFVFIYAESMERTFRNLDNIDYQPNINELANKYVEFTDLQQMPGMGWTMAGIVNTQCGIPLVIAQGNTGGKISSFLPGAQCIGSWLHENGYTTEFIRGSMKEFAGGDKFLAQHGWQTVHDFQYFIDNNMVRAEQVSGWGAHDDFLMDHAWNEFTRLSKKNAPFLLSFLTVNTHPPMGTLLNACNGKINEAIENEMLKSVACSDYLLSNFINKIIKSDAFDNTVIVLVSDHLMMGSVASTIIDKHADSRRNTFIVIKKGLRSEKVSRPGSLLDVWPTVLDIAGVQNSKLGFGVSLLHENKEGIVTANSKDGVYPYLALASSLWNYPKISDPMFEQNGNLTIGKQKYELPMLATYDENNRIDSIIFESIGRNMERVGKDRKKFFYAERCRELGYQNDNICAFNVTPSQIELYFISNKGSMMHDKKILNPIVYSAKLLGVSTGSYKEEGGASDSYNNYFFSRGINAFSLNSKENSLIKFDTCEGQEFQPEAVQDLYYKNKNPVVISTYNTLSCENNQPAKKLAELFHNEKLNSLGNRKQVIGFYTPEKKDIFVGEIDKPVDVFIDLDKQRIVSICQALSFCP